MTIELNTNNTATAEELNATLEELDRRQEEYEAAALAGALTPSAVTRIEGERRFATMRADAANRVAEAERSSLATEKEIRATVDELSTADALSVDTLIDALARVRAAATEFRRIVDERNNSISAWARKLNALGIPTAGLSVDGNPILLRSDSIAVGGSRVEMSSIEPYLSVAATTQTGDLQQLLERLRKDDRRGAFAQPVARIRYVKAVGGRKAGDVVTTLDISPSAAAQQVSAGYAELIEGDLPEVQEIRRQVFYGAANTVTAIDESN